MSTQTLPLFPDTSADALASQAGDKLRRDYARILDYLRDQREHGATRDEMSRALSMKLQTICPRALELIKSGRVIETERKRRTSSGQMARVLVAPIDNPCRGTLQSEAAGEARVPDLVGRTTAKVDD